MPAILDFWPAGSLHRNTIVSAFQSSLSDLFAVLKQTETQFIRCIKPNARACPLTFDAKKVVQQLRACGVVESIRISAQGLPCRMPYEAFVGEYTVLLPLRDPQVVPQRVVPKVAPYKNRKKRAPPVTPRRAGNKKQTPCAEQEHTKAIINHVLGNTGADGVAYGTTKVFLKDQQLVRLQVRCLRCSIPMCRLYGMSLVVCV